MPFYNYKCDDTECKHVMKNQLKNFKDKIIECSKCGGESSQQFSGLFAAHGLPNGHNAVRVNRSK